MTLPYTMRHWISTSPYRHGLTYVLRKVVEAVGRLGVAQACLIRVIGSEVLSEMCHTQSTILYHANKIK